MSNEPTDASSSPGIPPEVPATSPPLSGDVQELLAVADQVLSLERKHEHMEKAEGDEALEWHEVIELQAFIERKAWIEEKTKFLEQLPPIEVFVGMEAVHASATEVPGLPTREQLRAWVTEHDKIEKETEIFDSGELRKLKKFTKAAAQRNLSPADTDLIEIALTTIYALDKLLHLLRDRTENLDLLGVRLTWEERRIGAWLELRKLLEDLREFLTNRARWSPAVYENLEADEPLPSTGEHVLKRRGSTVSIASETSRASFPGYSRGARYKLAESLSKEAALFASRTSSLRHSKILPAGKTLDKLIDDSRRPVPDEILDEQDKLENEGMTAMEDMGKFVMQMVMQWKKADEFYVETLRDKSDAQTLLEEIEVAKLSHPTSRQDSSFISRAGALSKRLLLRGNPATSPLFPKPEHAHFPEQATSTEAVIQQLTSELSVAQQQIRKVETCAKEYRAGLEAVKQAEALRKSASDLTAVYQSLIDRLQNGVLSSTGDGSTPNLSTKSCLDNAAHSIFLSLFPTILQELDKANGEASSLIARSRASVLHLDFPGIDEQFKADTVAGIDALESSQNAAVKARDSVAARIAALSQVRKIWSSTGVIFHEVEGVRDEILDAMSRQMWRQQVRHDAPPTPESPPTILPAVTTSPAEVLSHLSQLKSKLEEDISIPLSSLAPSLPRDLREYVTSSSIALDAFLDSTSETARFWEGVQKQATMMCAVRDEVHTLQIRIEDLKVQYNQAIHDVSTGALDDPSIVDVEGSLTNELNSTRLVIQTFLDQLPARVSFVNETKFAGISVQPPSKRRPSPGSLSLDAIQQAARPSLPLDPTALDKGVRTDSNTYSMMLSGAMKSLEAKAEHLQLAKRARSVDVCVSSCIERINGAFSAIDPIRTRLVNSEQRLSTEKLSELSTNLEVTTQGHKADIKLMLVPVREALESLRTSPVAADMSTRDAIVSARTKAVETAETQYVSWQKEIATLKQQLAETHKTELHRLAEEARLREEQERLEAEAASLRAREEAAAAEAERLATLERLRIERERAEAEERARLERERAEAEEREELARLARKKAEDEERERRAHAEAEEKARLEREEAAKRAQAEATQRAKEEVERKAREEREKLDAERLEKQRLEKERLMREIAHAEEQARLARETAETEERALLERRRTEAEEKERRERQEAMERTAQEQERQRRRARYLAEDSALSDSPLETVNESAGDIFSIRPPLSSGSGLNDEMSELSSRIFSFRKRLRSIGINDIARPSSRSSSALPDEETCKHMSKAFAVLCKEVAALPESVPEEPVVNADLRSLRSELQSSEELMSRVNNLGDFAVLLRECDDALSDLLEHIDSYPSPPIGPLSAPHQSDVSLVPEEQLSARLSFTRDMLSRMKTLARALADDRRVPAEHERVLQTWTELEAMALDRINGQKSRPASVISSGRSSRASVIKSSSHSAKESPRIRASLDVHRPRQSLDKKGSFSKLSASPGKFLAPPPPVPSARRTASGPSVSTGTPRSSSRMSISSTRSVSGPMSGVSSSTTLFGSTYSSRQRTNSTTSNSSFASPTVMKRMLPNLPNLPSRPRAQTGQSRTSSPAVSDAQSRSSLNLPRPQSTVHSTWSRAPRVSFTSQPKSPPPRASSTRPVRKPYVANPKNKLDVAVGDVVNKLPVDIKIELVADTWKDQSGKYWIGDTDAKLCFCRILRSQTVMVRVGGGWQELSKFIKDHFADAFRLLPEVSPPRAGGREEKWISSSTLAQAAEIITPMSPPKTPEPKGPYLPSFALSTPSGTSPQSLQTSPSPGSPLHALQFIRRADVDGLSYRPETPTRSTRSGTSSVFNTPSRHHQPAWRP